MRWKQGIESFIMIQKSNTYARLTLARFIEKLEAQELKLRKKQKMKSSSVSQDIGLYFKSSQLVVS